MSLLSELLLIMVWYASESNQFSGVPSTHFGTFDFAELEGAAYEVEISSTPVSELQFQENAEGEADVMYMPVLSKHGQLYSCSLPPPLSDDEEDGEGGSLSSEKLPNISTLLKPLSESECLIKTVGWWTYEYCHEKFVRQYHMEAGRLVGQTKYLGFYERETEWDEKHINRVKVFAHLLETRRIRSRYGGQVFAAIRDLRQDESDKDMEGLLDSFKDNLVGSVTRAYHSVYYVNGTECDITRQPRSAKVEMYCTLEGVDKIVEVSEQSTCNYTLMVQTPLLCQHPMLTPLGNSAPSHTLSCTPVISQLDYEDYILKQELIRQQKEKLSAIQSRDDSTDNEKGSMVSRVGGEHQILRKLVMSSITQLANIASDSLYDAGYLEDQYDIELDLDEIDDDDKEVGAGSLKRDDSGGSERLSDLGDGRTEHGEERAANSEGNVQGEVVESSQGANDQKVSEKMKKMASDAKSTGRDSALESLLTNLAVTAEYIESLESTQTAKPAQDNAVPNGVSEKFETGEPGQRKKGQEGHGRDDTSANVLSVRGPQVDDGQDERTSRGEYAMAQQTEDRRTHRFSRDSVSGEIVAASEGESESEDEEDEELQLDPELVKKIKHELEETLAKQLDTKDITVKIITLPEDKQKEGGGEESVRTHADGGNDLSAAISKLLDSLLNGEGPVSQEGQKQSDLETSYDQTWGTKQKERRKSGR